MMLSLSFRSVVHWFTIYIYIYTTRFACSFIVTQLQLFCLLLLVLYNIYLLLSLYSALLLHVRLVCTNKSKFILIPGAGIQYLYLKLLMENLDESKYN